MQHEHGACPEMTVSAQAISIGARRVDSGALTVEAQSAPDRP
jgi:hypothetical protein